MASVARGCDAPWLERGRKHAVGGQRELAADPVAATRSASTPRQPLPTESFTTAMASAHSACFMPDRWRLLQRRSGRPQLAIRIGRRRPLAGGIVYMQSLSGLYAFKVGCRSDGGSCSPVWTNLSDSGGYSSPTIANGWLYTTSQYIAPGIRRRPDAPQPAGAAIPTGRPILVQKRASSDRLQGTRVRRRRVWISARLPGSMRHRRRDVQPDLECGSALHDL